VISYELLSGIAPFKRNTSMETLLAHAEEEVPPLGPKVPGLPEELVQLIEAMLAKEPGDRPTLAAVRTVLRRLKGTKIPTMTAAGIAMELPPTSTPTYSRPGTDELRTLDDNDVRTRPPPRSGPLPGPVNPVTTLAGTPGERASSPTFRERGFVTPRPPSNPSVSAAPLPPPPMTPPPIRDAPVATPMPPMQIMVPPQPMIPTQPPMRFPTPPIQRPMATPLPAASGTRRRSGLKSLIVIVIVAALAAGAALWFTGALS
jgi:serine/threonine protein kinase